MCPHDPLWTKAWKLRLMRKLAQGAALGLEPHVSDSGSISIVGT